MMPVSVAAVTAASRVAELCPRGVSGRPVTVSVPRQLAAGRRAAALVRASLVPLFADIIGPPSDGDDWRPSEGRPPPPPPAVSRPVFMAVHCARRHAARSALGRTPVGGAEDGFLVGRLGPCLSVPREGRVQGRDRPTEPVFRQKVPMMTEEQSQLYSSAAKPRRLFNLGTGSRTCRAID